MHGATHPASTFSVPFSRSFQESTIQMDGFVVEKLPGCGIAAVATGQTLLVINKGTEGVRFEQLFLGQKIHCRVDRASNRVLHVDQHTATLGLSDAAESISGRT